jgi:hypothetical protein
MYTAVSLGGQSPIRFKTKQWGNAWPGRTRYLSLSEAETALVLHYIDLLSSPDLSLKLKQNFKQTLNSRLDQDALFLPPFSYNSR